MSNQTVFSSTPDRAIMERLIEHPEIRVVDCYFILESLQFHTLPYIAEHLIKAKFTAHKIAEAMKLYMES